MKTNWQEYKAKDFQNLRGKRVKLVGNTIETVSMIVGATIYNTSHNEIDESSILFFAEKEDKTRYFKLQKHFETLNRIDEEVLDDLDFAICDILSEIESTDEVSLIFKRLKELVEEAKTKCLTESKKYI